MSNNTQMNNGYESNGSDISTYSAPVNHQQLIENARAKHEAKIQEKQREAVATYNRIMSRPRLQRTGASYPDIGMLRSMYPFRPPPPPEATSGAPIRVTPFPGGFGKVNGGIGPLPYKSVPYVAAPQPGSSGLGFGGTPGGFGFGAQAPAASSGFGFGAQAQAAPTGFGFGGTPGGFGASAPQGYQGPVFGFKGGVGTRRRKTRVPRNKKRRVTKRRKQ